MSPLKKQIRDTFFNPILHFLPLLILLVVDEFIGLRYTAFIAFPLGAIVLLYLYIWHYHTFGWHLFFASFLFVVAVIVGLFSSDLFQTHSPHIVGELFCLFLLFAGILFRPKVEKFIANSIENKLPMLNNTNEMYRIIWSMFYLLLFYVSIYSLLDAVNIFEPNQYIHIIQYLYALFTAFIIIYEILRVAMVRSKLIDEDWWPILNENGKIVGSIQSLMSLNEKNKYLHPVVRVLIIDKGMVLLQKRKSNDLIFPGLWDTAISNHVKVGETIEQCVERTASESCGLKNLKYMFLTNYSHNTPLHRHYAFLFVSCKTMDFKTDFACAESTKWWTAQQISENLNTGIFSDNFIKEFDLLQRSGLMEQVKCNCKCGLKDAVFSQLYKTEIKQRKQ